MSVLVLIVDDSIVVRQQVSIALRAAGYGVVQAADGAEGLVVLESNDQVRLVVCDVNMPHMNGLEFLERARSLERYRGLPILMATTCSQISLVERAHQARANGWLIKPFGSPALVSAVARALHDQQQPGA